MLGRFSDGVPSRLVQVGDGVKAKTVDAHVEPVVDDLENRLADRGVLVVEIGLVRVEAVPEVGFGDRIPGPV